MAAKLAIRAVLLIIANVAVLYLYTVALPPPGGLSLIAAVGSTITMNGVILLVRRDNFWAALRITVYALTGALVGLTCFVPYEYDHGFGEREESNLAGSILGAIIGALIATGITHAQSPDADSADNQSDEQPE